jgi:CheY-like chemotaxis protein
MQTGAVLIIDDDDDDHHIVREIWKELDLANELIFFTSGHDVLQYLLRADAAPFIIISDVNLPGMNGFELREKLLQTGTKKTKSVPFIFWSTQASEAQIKTAYELSAHGFFIKGNNYKEMKASFHYIINYWTHSKMPSKK